MESNAVDYDALTSILDRCNRDRVASILGATPQQWTNEGEGSAAVLVPLVTAEEGPSVLFTLRSRHMSRHRNQVSFPGGLSEESDDSPVATALREAKEELGIPPSEVDMWGKLPRLPNQVRLTMITPVIGCLHGLEFNSLRPNGSKVSQVFSLPLRQLVDPAHQRYTCFQPWLVRMLVFLGRPHRIWGFTAVIIIPPTPKLHIHFFSEIFMSMR